MFQKKEYGLKWSENVRMRLKQSEVKQRFCRNQQPLKLSAAVPDITGLNQNGCWSSRESQLFVCSVDKNCSEKTCCVSRQVCFPFIL